MLCSLLNVYFHRIHPALLASIVCFYLQTLEGGQAARCRGSSPRFGAMLEITRAMDDMTPILC